MAQVLRTHGISHATHYNWKSKYGSTSVAELKRLKKLEAANAELKRMYAKRALEITAIRDVLGRKLLERFGQEDLAERVGFEPTLT